MFRIRDIVPDFGKDPDPRMVLKTAPDLALFVNDLRDANKKYFFSKLFAY